MSIEPTEVKGASVDLHLGNEFLVLRPRRLGILRRPFDLGWERNETISKWYRVIKTDPERGIVIRPQSVTLARTEEYVDLPPKICAFVTGRSSIARLGIEVQCTQDLIGPGRHKTIPLQLVNNAPFPVRLYPGMRICQIIMARLGESPQVIYGSAPEDKYHNETDLRPSRFFLDPELKEKREKRDKNRDNFRLGAGQALVVTGGAISGGGVAILAGSSPTFGSWLAVAAGILLVAFGLALLKGRS